jgi:2-polyprenyl-3-methyl-5-hydroxy-6-metoxy-1,4-benzoquinol methylase
MTNKPSRGWIYATNGDYHRNLDPNWSYTPTYLRKMTYIHKYLDKLLPSERILDAGCGEGLLVEEYVAKGFLIEGLDLNYSNELVRQGNILSMPYENERFNVLMLLDVFEHLSFSDQPKALQEIRRVLKPNGQLVLSIPNLAHLNSRISLLFQGALDRTDNVVDHQGERPYKENLSLINSHGFDITYIKGITLTVPWIYNHIICKKPSQYRFLHDWLDHFAIPSISMLTFIIAIKRG